MSVDRRVCIVVLNWNGWRDTVACLESLFALEYEGARVVVVCDNGSTDDSVSQIREWAEARNLDAAALVVIENGANLGYAGGNNVGLRYAQARGDFDYVWLLNNDTVVDPKSLGFLVEKMEATGAGLGGSTLVYFDDRSQAQALGGASYDKWFARAHQLGAKWKPGAAIDEDAVARKLAYVSGAAMIVSKAFLDDVGLMDEGYFLYFEELDWIMRAKGKWRLAYASRSVVYHKEGASMPSKTSEYYYARARIRFTRRHHLRALPTTCLAIASRALERTVRGQTGQARAIVAAGVDGLLGRKGARR